MHQGLPPTGNELSGFQREESKEAPARLEKGLENLDTRVAIRPPSNSGPITPQHTAHRGNYQPTPKVF